MRHTERLRVRRGKTLLKRRERRWGKHRENNNTKTKSTKKKNTQQFFRFDL